jgi:hypothetical protein
LQSHELHAQGQPLQNESTGSAALHFLFILLVAAILANGMYFWLQRSQVIETTAYLQALNELQDRAADDTQLPGLWFAAMYETPKGWIFSKLLKDIFILAFGIASLLALRHSRPVISTALLLPSLLGLSIAAAFLASMHLYGTWVAIAGLRPFAYLLAGLIAVWATHQRSLELLSRYLLAVLIIELILSFYEFAYGIPLFNSARFGNRVVGTFSFPASLGIFAITVGVFAFTFSRINKLLLLALSLAFIYLTGSATALVLLAVALAMWAAHSTPDRWKLAVRLTSYGLIAAMLLALPKMVARYDVLNSLWGRIEPVTDYIAYRPSYAEILFGKGLGIGSNIVNSAIKQSKAVEEPAGVDLFHARADSTPLALFNQIGIVGGGAFLPDAGAGCMAGSAGVACLCGHFRGGNDDQSAGVVSREFFVGDAAVS